MLKRSINSSKEFINSVPKGILAVGAISLCCLMTAGLVVLGAKNSSQADERPVNTSWHDPRSTSEPSADTAGGHVAGATTDAQSSQPTPSSNNNVASSNASTTNSASSGMSGTKSTPAARSQPTTPAQPAASRADYNLNETWYFATAGTAGLYNTCWPTELNESNEAQCADPNSPYSQTWFNGIGISKSAQTAQELAANQAHQKDLAQHVDPRKGGGGDATVLNEALCSQYSLSCGRR